MSERIAPHSLEAERSVLGSVFIRPAAWPLVASMLVTDAFYLPAHREVFEAMEAVVKRSMPLDVLMVGDELKSRGALTRLEGGEGYLLDLAGSVPVAENVEHYVRIVLDNWNRRRVIALCSETMSRAYLSASAEDLVENLAGDVSRIVMPSANALVRIGECVPAVLADIEHRMAVGPEKAMAGRVTFGVDRLDELTVGCDPGDLVIIGADAGGGKTALAVQAGLKLTIDEGGVCLCANLEMSRAQITERSLSHRGRVNSFNLRRGQLRKDEFAELYAAGQSLIQNHHGEGGQAVPTDFYREDRIQGIEEFEVRARAVRARHPKQVALGIFDFMQLAKSSGRQANRAQEISDIARRLKKLGGDLEMTIFGISSLKRKQTEASEKPPSMSDLKESGDVEYAATTILLIWNQDQTEDGAVDIIAAKNKKGPRATIRSHWTGRHYAFRDWDGDASPSLPGMNG